MTSGNKQTALDFIQALSDGGFAAVGRFFTDDFVYWAPGVGEIQDQLPEFVKVVSRYAPDGIRLVVHGVTAEGDRVAVEAESFGTLTTGAYYNNLYHYLLEFRGGKICKVKEYFDSKHWSEVWGAIEMGS